METSTTGVKVMKGFFSSILNGVVAVRGLTTPLTMHEAKHARVQTSWSPKDVEARVIAKAG